MAPSNHSIYSTFAVWSEICTVYIFLYEICHKSQKKVVATKHVVTKNEVTKIERYQVTHQLLQQLDFQDLKDPVGAAVVSIIWCLDLVTSSSLRFGDYYLLSVISTRYVS